MADSANATAREQADREIEVVDVTQHGDVHSEPDVVDSPEHSDHDDDTKPAAELQQDKSLTAEGSRKVAFEDPTSTEVAAPDFPINIPVLIETLERRDLQRFSKVFGGVEGFVGKVKSNVSRGIDTDSITRRQEVFGVNELAHAEPVTFLEMLLDAFGDRVIQILCVAALISIVFGLALPNPYTGHVEAETGWIEGTAIVISILVVTLTGSIQNYNKAKKFEEMEREQSVKLVSVVRNGTEVTIQSNELVVGDILVLETGMELVCDGILISGSDLRTNESPITGEPDLIEKRADKDVFLISGTSVEEGTGVVVVAAVGQNSFQGQMKQALQQESAETPLQEHLTELGDNIGKIGLAGAAGLLIALTIKEVILIGTDQKAANASSFLGFVIIAVTLIAVAIPEGLPLAVTISLAFSMRAMMAQNCMVRVLASCETMGAATAVCSDKTGTLTTNEMTTVQALVTEHEFILEGYGLHKRNEAVVTYLRQTLAEKVALKPDVIEKLSFAFAINSTARRQVNDAGEKVWVGNKTEAGILGLVERFGKDISALRSSVSLEQVKQYPFSSAKKRMTTIVKHDSTFTAYTKGASEIILAACTHYLDCNGTIAELIESKREEFNAIIVDMASQGNRTIGVAFKNCDLDSLPDEEPDVAYVFLGVLGIQDPIRQEVPSAVAQCASAHLTVRMVTGDNINTAIAISKKCGLFDPEQHIAMTGPDFREMYRKDKQGLIDLLPRLRVLARSSPNDKFVLVGLLQDEHGEVVGVTGDGTNDAPALKLADVGFAMNTGTDIAKGAADMVLIDDNFATVVTAIRWGRAVNDNIKKFLQYQLAINFAGVGLTIIGSLASSNSKEPLAAVQLLWLNLIMDTLAALSLATELPEDACLTRLPVYKQAPLITNKMRAFIGIHGVYQLTIVLLVLFLGHEWFETSESSESCKEVGGVEDGAYCQQGRVHSTMLFNIFIWFQIFNVVNGRKIYGEWNCFEGLLSRSRVMLIVFTIIIGLQVFAVEVCGDFLSTTGLDWKRWLICIGFGASELLVGFFVRRLPVEDYIPTKEEILAARREQQEKEKAAAAQASSNESDTKGDEVTPAPHTVDPDVDTEALKRRQSRVKIDEHPPELKRRGTLVGGDSSLKRSMSIRKAH
jgi:Ca2+-transporting ATPase